LGVPDLDIESAADAAADAEGDAPPTEGTPVIETGDDNTDDAATVTNPPSGSSTAPPVVTPAPATNPPVSSAVPGAATPTTPPASASAPTPQATVDPRTVAESDETRVPVPAETAPVAGPTAVDDTGQNPNGATVTTVPGPGDGSSDDGTDGAGSTTAIPVPPIAAVTGKPADASIRLPTPSIGGARGCDTDGDGEADARCQLLVEYECKSVDQLRDGFVVADVDGDGAIDWCLPDVATGCDLDGDGRSDLACVIRPIQENVVGTGP
jgi:hypothetical protein